MPRWGTPRQYAECEASPYHFRVHYDFRHEAGCGDGHTTFGAHSSPPAEEEMSRVLEVIGLRITADVQADGHSFDPSTLTVTVTRIEPLT